MPLDFRSGSPYNKSMDCTKLSDQPSQPDNTSVILIEPLLDLKEPDFYHVILLNDDYTPMDFVLEVLMNLFNKNHHDAYAIMMEVHTQEKGIAGTYMREIAEEKMNQVLLSAQANDFPLNCMIERV